MKPIRITAEVVDENRKSAPEAADAGFADSV